MSRSLAGVLVLLASASWALADKGHHKVDQKPQIVALRLQIKELQVEEKTVLKAIRMQYESILQENKLSKSQRDEIKAALRKEEKDLLALATSTDEKEAIREQFQLLLQVLSGEVQLDKEVIDKIKKQEKAQLALVRAIFKAKIKELQNIIHALEQTGHVKGHK
jgi:hypothetical protein